jgi:hypothetical protein
VEWDGYFVVAFAQKEGLMEPKKASGNFEVEQLPNFLSRLKTLVDSGFDESEILPGANNR